ncbi:AAA-domain-containing protein [Rhizodiscina lignyota]|uniref:AAA-domain-containing protein n=1 Tax=Rhizodiscina lignyota TaxID=1504668 RepID=A0A9P4I6S3_9PEZI|nr:AAA-domain-containing protein [Rhizodiscina lignyota]
MTGRRKKVLADDPLADDPEDLDYGAPSPKRPRSSAGKPKHSKSSARPRKRKQQTYNDSADDITDDEEDDSLEEESFGGSDAEEAAPKVNPRTGRATRRATEKVLKYEEVSSDSDIGGIPDSIEADESEPEETGSKNRKRSVSARASADIPRRNTRTRSQGADAGLELDESGKRPRAVRSTSGTPGPTTQRSTRATKGVKGTKGAKSRPSIIVEEDTQEGSSKDAAEGEGQGDGQGGGQGQDEGGDEDEGDEDDDDDDEDDEDEGPISRRRRKTQQPKPQVEEDVESRPTTGSKRKRKAKDDNDDDDVDFTPDDEEEGVDDDMSEPAPKKRRGRASSNESHDRRRSDTSVDSDELAEEAAALAEERTRSSRRRRKQTPLGDQPRVSLRGRPTQPDYRLRRPELDVFYAEPDEAPPAVTPRNNRRGAVAAAYRSLFPVAGPFGGTDGNAGAVDSDSSDDEPTVRRRPTLIGGAVGMTPSSAGVPSYFPKPLNADPAESGMRKIKNKGNNLADADALGIDPDITFDSVGGRGEEINGLKEMVVMPLLYPEMYQKFQVTPPRGVLFSGPPGTGKTLMARALCNTKVSGKKITFYMRKAGDVHSKWVGESERQLRTLFEEARKNQPSIIFFDEIDGLAPQRTGATDQSHISIVTTLLALMDGMDDRGQVVVIGATNRPGNIDVALRRPGRFDREFYFSLPNEKGRREIIDIHTKGWSPPLMPDLKDMLATRTENFSGADIRSLCTEAAMNAIQGTYPQLYSSTQKLQIDVNKIQVTPKDFMMALEKVTPSGERASTTALASMPKELEPLLRGQLQKIMKIIDEVIPRKQRFTALEEAEFEDRGSAYDEFGKETLKNAFEKNRIYRPRLLIHGTQGMGQQHLGAALLSKLESLHVQSFDLSTLFEDGSLSQEATIVRLFREVRTHMPSVIYIPNVDIWYDTVGSAVIKTFMSQLRSLPANSPVLVVGTLETEMPLKELQKNDDEWAQSTYAEMMRDLFSYSRKSQYEVGRPDEPSRREYFEAVTSYIRKRPADFPSENRKKRKLDVLPVIVEEPKPQAPPSKEELRQQRKNDRMTLNLLKISIQPIMDQIRTKHKKFRTAIIDDASLAYLYTEQDPTKLSSDLTAAQRAAQQIMRPYELEKDKHGIMGIKESESGKFYYNLDTVMIEKRLSNGYYKRPKDFLADIRRIAKDAKTLGDEDRILKANEMLANVEVDIETILEAGNPDLVAECERVYGRELERQKEAAGKAQATTGGSPALPFPLVMPPPPQGSMTTEDTGPIVLGEKVPSREFLPPLPTTTAPSQRSALVKVAAGSHAGDYLNSASTTTSGQKASERASGASDLTNGLIPDFSGVGQGLAGSSQLPDTQEDSSQPLHTLDEALLGQLHNELAVRTSGLSVEQLEQLNAAMMDAVWRLRGEADRTAVVRGVTEVFNDTIEDITAMQLVLDPSQRHRGGQVA